MNQPVPNVEMEIKAFMESSGPHLLNGRRLLTSLERLSSEDRTEPSDRLMLVLKEYLELFEMKLAPQLKLEAKPAGKPAARGKPGDHRAIPRFHHKYPIRYSPLGKSLQWRKGYSHDVGAMGLFILSNRLEKAGQNLVIEIEIPDLGKVRMQGAVVWTKWVPPSLRTVENTGFGVKISQAPENWFKYFLTRKSS